MQHPAAGSGTTDPFVAGRYDEYQEHDGVTAIRSTREKFPFCSPISISAGGGAPATEATLCRCTAHATPLPAAGPHSLHLTRAEIEVLLALVLSADLFGGEAERSLLTKIGDCARTF